MHNGSEKRPNVWELMRENINLMILIGMLILGTVISPNFLTARNLMNVLRQISVNGVMAVGFTFVALAGGFDLSIGATLAVCGCFATGLLLKTNMAVAITVALLAGAAIGLANGILLKITRGALSETFLITLGMSLVGTCIAMTYTGGFSVNVAKGHPYRFIGQGTIAGIPFSVILLVIIMLAGQIVLSKTSYGRKIYLTGGSKETAFASGINVSWIKTSVFMIAGVLAAVAGIMQSSRTTTAVYSMGDGADFDACIACFIGGNKCGGGKGGMFQTLIGVIIFGLISNILNLGGVESSAQQILKGAILLLAIVLDGFKRS